MSDQKAKELLKKHNIKIEDVETGRTSLHHLRHIVRNENLQFDVFQALVRLRR